MTKYYSNAEVESIYGKVAKVLVSCRAVAQLYSAHKYSRLFLVKVHPLHKKIIVKRINKILTNQKIKVRLHEFKSKKDKKTG